MFKKITDLFLFSSAYIALCAVVMTHQTNWLLKLELDRVSYGWFVFFSTMCSYNFHWLLTNESHEDSVRLQWTNRNRQLHRFLFITCGFAAAIFLVPFLPWWPWLGLAGLLTFLYSAPKIPYSIFLHLRKIAYGKTIFLSAVWTYVTTLLPMIISKTPFDSNTIWFTLSRFFLIYAICIIFDLRDREPDKKAGIQSLITYLSLSSVRKLFYFSLLVFTLSIIQLKDVEGYIKWILLSPGIITALLYNRSYRSTSDYLYYFILDGLMMFSAAITLVISLFV